ncbi:MAG TPA: septation protein SepH [Streptosporangiaceae bacterium]|nr:septation protein SepH [Streptosporangiaceae bacterium]
MQELRLVAVSEDGSYAVLTVPGRSGRFALPIDERLRTVARGQFSRLAQYDIEVESPLRPKEIQDRIRAGETAEEIADAAGLPVDRIRRFEGPVLAEREFRATEAQRATVRSPGESGFGPRLSEVVADRLADIGAGPEDQEWDSRKRQDGNWQVQLAYTVGGRMYVAEWVYDPRNKHVTPADDEAIRLSLDESQWPGPRNVSAADVKATVTQIGSRTAAHAASTQPNTVHPNTGQPNTAQPNTAQPNTGHQAEADRAGGRTIVHPSRQAPAAQAPSQAPAGGKVASASQVAAVSKTAAAVAATSQASVGAQAGASQATAADPGAVGQPDPPAVSGPVVNGQSTEAPNEQDPPQAVPEAPARPARRASGGRSRRSSVPSWDEIMFGSSRQPD